jgi:prolyl oligopeptidase
MGTVPAIRGDRAFFLQRSGDQEHPVLRVREADGSERTLIDPAGLSIEGTTTLDEWTPSKEGHLLAYSLSEEGDEETLLRVMDVATGEIVDGPIDRTRYGSVAWLPGETAFFYVRKLPPGEVPTGEEQLHRRIYRHRLGSDPAHDDLVFGVGREKGEYFGVRVSLDGRWLLVEASVGTAPRNDLYIADLTGDVVLRPVQEGVDAIASGSVRDGRLYLMTNLGAPRFRIAVADPEHPQTWQDLIPETDAVLSGYALTDDAVVVASTRHAVGTIAVHDRLTGEHRRSVGLPGLGSVAGLASRPDGGDQVWIGYTDFLTPPKVYRYGVADASLELWADAPGSGSPMGGATARQAFYRSKDGTEVAMFILRPPEAGPSANSGSRPTILYGYGGFNVPLTPAYTPLILAWVMAGGVYVIANIRGGSEEGEEWHRAGMRERKQNVFDDFIAAAEWLVAEGITSPEQLAISGGSNGGLLVGAALTQRPDLFAAVVCSAPLLDMVRYERFGLGVTWNDEYGRADHPEELEWLLGYSPYHHVVEGEAYPGVLFTVFESDTRVDPLHARKMCAALQWATSSRRPILLRRETKVGHGARAISREIELNADKLVFLQDQLNLHGDAAGEGSASAPA